MAFSVCWLATIVSKLLFVGLFFSSALCQVFVTSNGSFIYQLNVPPNLSAACAATFSQPVVCDPRMWLVAVQGLSPNATDLGAMCNTTCVTNLQALRSVQASKCTAADNITVSYKVYPATYQVDLLLYTQNYACQTSTSGQYCFPLFEAYNTDNTTSPSDLCSACNLKTWQALLSPPLGYDPDHVADYSSLTSSCKATGYPVASPTTSYMLGTTVVESTATTTHTGVAPTYTCESTYTIQKNDTCLSISQAKQVSTFYLLFANKLPAFCTEFPAAGTSLCIPQKCNIHIVAPWDTCDDLAKSSNVTIDQLVSYNPNLNKKCGNLRSLLGYVICLSPPGTFNPPTTRRARPTTTSIFADPCRNPGAPDSCFPSTRAYATFTPSVRPWPTVTVNISDTTSKTASSTQPAWTDPASLPRPSGTRTGFNGTQLMQWNPSLSYNVTNETTWSSCLFQKGFGYCVKL
ncbi:hypothetical protein B0T19DRAFT_443814 [Cercophora scortea]|uniref:LysM domain-containing protein n=1 Tax=Cercophora scortea TaxID=314031 RepID=A0AAE0IFX0_9PEZI|nr:hypothetical protein B0T19DRAFT_443814 [Cercophora scortea]